MAIVFEEQELYGFGFNETYGVYMLNSNHCSYTLEKGMQYLVTWDGIVYECVAQDMSAMQEGALALGNMTSFGGTGNDEPFIIGWSEFGETYMSFESAISHTLAIEKIEEAEEKAGADIVLYDRTGAAVKYENVETITTDTPDAEQGATFTYGVAVDNAEYEPDFSEGNQKVTLEKGQLLKEFTLVKPEMLLPEYIKKNVKVAGVVGEFAGDEMEKTVLLNMAEGDQVIEADEDTVLTKVTVIKPETLIPANIADGVNIGGIEGIHKDYSKEIIEGTVVSVANAQVSQIAPYAFYINKVMEKADFPNCKTIGEAAFQGCSALVDISFPNCEVISGFSTFVGCTALPEVIFPKCTSLGGGSTFMRCLSLSKVEFPLCSSIPNGAFSSCPKLVSVSFPECTYIGTGAFYSCSGLEYIAMEKCEQIGQSAFAMCSKLSSCSFPNIRELHSLAFGACTKLSQSSSYVYYVEDMAVYASSTFNSSSCTFKEGTRLIAQHICLNKSKMVSVAGLENVEIIGQSAFYSCFSARFSYFSKVKYIGNGAFGYCSSLYDVDIPECTEAGNNAFTRCVSLYNANIPMVAEVKQGVFAYCSKLLSVNVKNAKTIGSNAFNGCWSLQTIFLPNCQSIYSSAFYGCSSLRTAIIGDHKTLASYAFASCYNLVSLYLLGSSVGGSGGYMLNSTPINGYSTYAGKYGSIFVRESLLNAFKTSWKTWSSRFVGMTDDEIAALYAEWGYTE